MIALAEPDTAAHPWDKAAVGWNDHTKIIHAWLHDATQMMLDTAHIKLGSRVLDIAAGAGDQTLDIARRVGENGYVLATDISTRILELAQHNASAEGFSQVETRVADAQSLALDGANFDAAVCRLGLMFCSDPLAALNGARVALKPGARISALVFSGPQNNPCLAIMTRAALKHAGLAAESQSPFAPGTLMSLGKPGLFAHLLNDTSFVDINVQAVSAPFRLPSSRHYIDFVRSAGSPIMQILAPLTLAEQRDAWDDMEAQLNDFSTTKHWVGPHELLLCSATAAARSAS
jgi:ubiquinone/menaquinone biosynthesis C-methylase UbiE